MTMMAILSTTTDTDLYLFNLPFAVYSWKQIGAEVLIFWTNPDVEHRKQNEKAFRLRQMELVAKYCHPFRSCYIEARREQMPTYAQCARLYAAAIPNIPGDEILVTADADMCVFDGSYWANFIRLDKCFHVVGYDLVEPGQYPMCYLLATAESWRKAMKIKDRTYQQCLDALLASIETENMRGNYWCKDQETAFNLIQECAKNSDGPPVYLHNRAIPGLTIANRRADRDGWPAVIDKDILDAHLPRPGYIPGNFDKIRQLFRTMYPDHNLEWMEQYYNEYINSI